MKAAHTASTSSPPRFQGKYCNYCRQLITSRQYRHPLQAWCFLSSVSTENTGGRGGRGGGNTQPDFDTLPPLWKSSGVLGDGKKQNNWTCALKVCRDISVVRAAMQN